MCTVSVIALHHGFRLVSNRDEQRSRPDALPPQWRRLGVPGSGDLRVIWPTDRLRDGREGGTWIGASERGLAMTVLNLNRSPPRPPPSGAASRGDLIPALLHLNSAHAAASALHAMDLARFPSFRLIAVEQPTPDEPPVVAEVRWDGAVVASVWHRPPVCFASSGLGDDLVQVRLPLFEDLVVRSPAATLPQADPPHDSDPSGHDRSLAQDAFHAHVWTDRRHLSVMMDRADARTVSTTSVRVVRDPWTGRASVEMNYVPVPNAGDSPGVGCGGGLAHLGAVGERRA